MAVERGSLKKLQSQSQISVTFLFHILYSNVDYQWI